MKKFSEVSCPDRKLAAELKIILQERNIDPNEYGSWEAAYCLMAMRRKIPWNNVLHRCFNCSDCKNPAPEVVMKVDQIAKKFFPKEWELYKNLTV
jgi:hypothetical protein